MKLSDTLFAEVEDLWKEAAEKLAQITADKLYSLFIGR